MRRCTWPVALALVLAAVLSAAASTGGSDVAARTVVDHSVSAADDASIVYPPIAANVAVSPYADDLYVAYEYSKFLERPLFDTMGTAKGSWETPTLPFGALVVAVNPETGYTWSAKWRLGRMWLDEYNEVGRHQESWRTGFTGYPANISINGLGDVSILLNSPGSRGYKAEILTFISNGTLQGVKSTTFDAQAAAAVRDDDGITYVTADDGAGAGVVRRLDGDGFVDAEWPASVRPGAIATGPEDVLVAGIDTRTWGGAVHRFGRDGTDLGRWRVGGRPLSIDLGPDESVYILTQPSPGLSLTVEKRTLQGQMLLRWSVVSSMFLPWLSPGP